MVIGYHNFTTQPEHGGRVRRTVPGKQLSDLSRHSCEMRDVLLAVFLAAPAAAFSSAVLDDLERRALAALQSIPHAATKADVERQRQPLRDRLEAALGLERGRHIESASALLYTTPGLQGPSPAIIVVHPHETDGSTSRTFSSSLARLGFIVLDVNVRIHHDFPFDQLPAGVTRQGLNQRDIRRALAYLLSRRDVDHRRIGLAGTGLGAAIAAAINPQFSAVVLSNAAPDFKELIQGMRAQTPLDLCDIVPGMLHYAATEELFALIAPRPVLAINPAQSVSEYANEVYRSFALTERLNVRTAPGLDRESRFAAYGWFGRWLRDRDGLPSFSEDGTSVLVADLQLRETRDARQAPATRNRPLSGSTLASILGAPLPEAHPTIGLKVAREQSISVTTQPGIHIPITVLRSGPEGADQENGILVALDDRGRAALRHEDIALEALRRRWMVWSVDPRGIGELKCDSDGFVLAMSLLLGEHFVWRQASDITRILDLAGRATFTHRVSLYARGVNSTLAALYVAAVADGTVPAWVVLRDPIVSFGVDSRLPRHLLPFNTLNTFDVRDLLAAAKPRVSVINDPDDLSQWEW